MAVDDDAASDSCYLMQTWSYEYNDLPDGHMRYLELWPGEFDDDVVMTLNSTLIKDAPTYQAISYVWGALHNMKTISIMESENWTGFGVIQVTSNLYQALRHIRRPDIELRLWADAICIDQSRIAERNHQVKSMGSIYSNAAEVLVWLGPDTEGKAATAFSDQKRVDFLLRPHSANRQTYLSAWSWVLTRAWSPRVWTVQEIGLASSATIICGEARTTWQAYVRTYSLICDTTSSSTLAAWSIQSSQAWLLHNWRDWNNAHGYIFLDIVLLTQNRDTSDRRDKIYALLMHPSATISPPISSALHRQLIVSVDYRRDTQMVFTDAAFGMIRQTGTLDVLSAVRLGSSEEALHSPSWVPDWNTQPTTYSLLTSRAVEGIQSSSRYYARDILGNILGPACAQWTQLLPGELSVQGFVGGKVKSHVNVKQFLTDPASIHHSANVPGDHASRSVRQQSAAESILDLAKLAQRLGYCPGVQSGPPLTELNHLAFAGTSSEVRSDLDGPLQLLKELCVGREIFLTLEGTMGLAPARVEVKDEIFLLRGAKVPYLLRVKREQEFYLIGECLVEGMMEGGMVAEASRVGTREVIIV